MLFCQAMSIFRALSLCFLIGSLPAMAQRVRLTGGDSRLEVFAPSYTTGAANELKVPLGATKGWTLKLNRGGDPAGSCYLTEMGWYVTFPSSNGTLTIIEAYSAKVALTQGKGEFEELDDTPFGKRRATPRHSTVSEKAVFTPKSENCHGAFEGGNSIDLHSGDFLILEPGDTTTLRATELPEEDQPITMPGGSFSIQVRLKDGGGDPFSATQGTDIRYNPPGKLPFKAIEYVVGQSLARFPLRDLDGRRWTLKAFTKDGGAPFLTITYPSSSGSARLRTASGYEFKEMAQSGNFYGRRVVASKSGPEFKVGRFELIYKNSLFGSPYIRTYECTGGYCILRAITGTPERPRK
jgi:hypothetical protein